MTRLAILFGWDALLVSDPVSFVVSLSHDEITDLYAANSTELDQVAEQLAKRLWTPIT